MFIFYQDNPSKKQAAGHEKSRGYLLPVVIALSLGISTVGVFAMQVVNQGSATLSAGQYSDIAREAARSGIEAVAACAKNSNYNAANPGQGTGCTNNDGPDGTTVVETDEYKSSFVITAIDDTDPLRLYITSRGIVGTAQVRFAEETVHAYVNATSTTSMTPGYGGGAGRPMKYVTQMNVGPANSCAVASDTQASHDYESWVYCWGTNGSGQLGNGKWSRDDLERSPREVATNTGPQGYPAPCTSRWPNGNCFGYGEVTPTQQASALMNTDGTRKYVTKVSVGFNHACAIAKDTPASAITQAYCWGNNDRGQLGYRWSLPKRHGLDRTERSYVPVAVDTSDVIPGYCGGVSTPFGCAGWVYAEPASALRGKNVIDIQAGQYFTCVIAQDGANDATRSVICWGENSHGQLGTGNRDDKDFPVAVNTGSSSDLNGKVPARLAEFRNNQHACVIATDETVICWGRNYAGQTANDTNPSRTSCTKGTSTKISSDRDVLRPNAIYNGGRTAAGWAWRGFLPIPFLNLWWVKERPASSLQGKTVKSLEVTQGYTSALADDDKGYWWGGYSYQENCDPGGSGNNASDGTRRYYYAVSRPIGPIYDNNTKNTCWWIIFSRSCNSTTDLDGKPIAMASGNQPEGSYCAVTGPDLYCASAPFATSTTLLFFPTKEYYGQLGDGTKPGAAINTGGFFDALNPQYADPQLPRLVRMAEDGPSSSGLVSHLRRDMTIQDIQVGASREVVGSRTEDTNQLDAAYGACVLASNQVLCWGRNDRGQLGDGTGTSRGVPTFVDTRDGCSDLGQGPTTVSTCGGDSSEPPVSSTEYVYNGQVVYF